MRRVQTVEKPNETYSFAAVDQQTGEVPLRRCTIPSHDKLMIAEVSAARACSPAISRRASSAAPYPEHYRPQISRGIIPTLVRVRSRHRLTLKTTPY
jgi:hypothetical protein